MLYRFTVSKRANKQYVASSTVYPNKIKGMSMGELYKNMREEIGEISIYKRKNQLVVDNKSTKDLP